MHTAFDYKYFSLLRYKKNTSKFILSRNFQNLQKFEVPYFFGGLTAG